VIFGRNDSKTQVHWWAGIGHVVGKGQARFYVRDRAGKGVGVSGTKLLTDGLWHHVVAVRDAAGSELRVYVDGVLEGTASTSYSSDFVAPSAKLTMGWMDSSGGVSFKGDLDEVALHNQVLMQDDIAVHYNKGIQGYGYFAE
jgi:hypothetical protein